MILRPNVSGIFYPSDRDELLYLLDEMREKIERSNISAFRGDIKDIKALILPHAGYMFSGEVAMGGYFFLNEMKDVKRIFLWGPSHYFSFEGVYQPATYKYWETPLGKVEIEHYEDNIPQSDEVFYKEHSLEVHLPFLQYFFSSFKVKPLLFGSMYAVRDISPAEDEVIIVSSDLSHYLSYEECVKKDKETLNLILKKDIRGFIKYGDACGKNAIASLLFLAQKYGWKGTLITYKNSGDVTGDYSHVVGYASVMFYE